MAAVRNSGTTTVLQWGGTKANGQAYDELWATNIVTGMSFSDVHFVHQV